MSIKVLHVVSGSLNGGASKGALYLHKYLLDLGVDSKILFEKYHGDEKTETQNIFYYQRNWYEKVTSYFYKFFFYIIYNLIFFRSHKFIYTTGLFGVNIKKDKLFKEANIIHLHSVNDFLSFNTIKGIKKPIVWTIRDMWMMTGGCHLPNYFNCEKYKLNCLKCDQLNSKTKYDISFHLHKIKKKFIMTQNNILFVAISDFIKESFMSAYKNKRINRIYNITDQENFFAENSVEIKKLLNINTSKKILLFGSQRISDPLKGAKYLDTIISKLDPKLYFIISFGINDSINLSRYGFDHINFGEVKDPNLLRKIYSVSNLFICTSIGESFGKTVLESLLCSTPVVAFDVFGINEIIIHRKNGFLAKPFDIDDFVFGIHYILDLEKDWSSTIMIKKRLAYLEPFSVKIIPRLYLDEYKKIVNNKVQ